MMFGLVSDAPTQSSQIPVPVACVGASGGGPLLKTSLCSMTRPTMVEP